ncbi:hypothetical protein DPMN_074432 [Dreissena polymorpha]|uniref:Uncharacterized protein n=1 Tax=Dreissena polymorpha TaxID=45954 RepID=A0A9D3YJ84_DREPO|nr:hypothetical protein DPMN_074432 [Dreissena polymorpha]
MPNVEILVENGSKELFEIFRDTGIWILDLGTADCVSHTSDILPTLSKLEKLYLRGIYTGHCALQLLPLLHCVSLVTCECSSVRLCSLLISELDNHVKCELWDFVLRSVKKTCDAVLNIYVSDVRSELL